MPKPYRSLAALLPILGLGSLLRFASADAYAQSEAVPQKTASLRPISATSLNTPDYPFDTDAERQLLDLANQARSKAGAPLLRLDSGLSRAARTHAEQMAAAGQISHRFDGEPALIVRLASSTALRLECAGENVALDSDPEGANEHLMRSPPHRENLLNPSYDVVGLGVVNVGDRLYIVQDFGRALPDLTTRDVKDQIAVAVAGLRQQGKQSTLPRHDLTAADTAACSMAQADSLAIPAVRQLASRYSLLAYTTQHPEQLPAGSDAAVSSHDLRSFSVGACYARTAKYPSGTYWVVLALQ